MDLYRIILVDDEEEVRKSIIRKIDWQAVGFTVVGDAENGEDALEKIEALEPDVVLTDIRMPYMDGLTLAEKIRQRYPSMKIVIFSGYDDFDYAKRAIKLNVTEYILKPVNVEELTAILRRIQESLDEEIEQKRDVSLLRENYRRSLPILREQFLKDLVSHQMDGKTVNDRLEQYDIPLAGAKKWISIAVKAEISEVSGELIPISVMQILEENLKPYCRFSLFSFSGAADAEIAGIVAIDENNSQTSMIDILSDICKEIRKILMIPVTIGIGHSRTELGLICESFRSALDALGYCAIVGSGSTIYINDVEPVNTGKLQFTAEDESALIQAVKFGPEEKIRSVVSGIIGRMSDAKVHARQYQTYMFSTANCLVQLIQQYDLEMGVLFGDTGMGTDPFMMIRQVMNREKFSKWLLEAALRINGAMDQERDNTTRQSMERAERYIMENYQDPDLSVEQVCRTLHMSPAYFSTMFKKATGQTYIGYLTDVRLNKAVELLNKTDDKTYVIAAKVGYQEQNYFSYVFKKKFGVSPTKFRGSRS